MRPSAIGAITTSQLKALTARQGGSYAEGRPDAPLVATDRSPRHPNRVKRARDSPTALDQMWVADFT